MKRFLNIYIFAAVSPSYYMSCCAVGTIPWGCSVFPGRMCMLELGSGFKHDTLLRAKFLSLWRQSRYFRQVFRKGILYPSKVFLNFDSLWNMDSTPQSVFEVLFVHRTIQWSWIINLCVLTMPGPLLSTYHVLVHSWLGWGWCEGCSWLRHKLEEGARMLCYQNK